MRSTIEEHQEAVAIIEEECTELRNEHSQLMAELELRDQEIRVLAERKKEVKRRKKELEAQTKCVIDK